MVFIENIYNKIAKYIYKRFCNMKTHEYIDKCYNSDDDYNEIAKFLFPNVFAV